VKVPTTSADHPVAVPVSRSAVPEESEETDTRHLGDLETDTGNITLGMPGATESSH